MYTILDHSEDCCRFLVFQNEDKKWLTVEEVCETNAFASYVRNLPEPKRIHLQSTILAHQINKQTPQILPPADSVDSYLLSSLTVGGFDTNSIHSDSSPSSTGIPESPNGTPGSGKRGRGRPRKHPIVTPDPDTPIIKRGRGRPRKHPVSSEQPTTPDGEIIKRKRGRPRKYPVGDSPSSDDSPSVKRGRGRPRKQLFPDITDDNSHTSILIDGKTSSDDIIIKSSNNNNNTPSSSSSTNVIIESNVSIVNHISSSDDKEHQQNKLELSSSVIDSEEIDSNGVPVLPHPIDTTIGNTDSNFSHDDVFAHLPKKRGRPRNSQSPVSTSIDSPDTPKRGRGRPRKYPPPDPTIPKRGRGRPPKEKKESSGDDESGMNGSESPSVKRGRGRPRKQSSSSSNGENDTTPKRGRGRPRKYPKLDEDDSPNVPTE